MWVKTCPIQSQGIKVGGSVHHRAPQCVMLTTSEIELYHEKGLIIPRDFRLPATEVECLRSAVDSVATNNPDTPTDFLFNVHLDQAPPLRLVGHSAFSTLVTDDKILDMVEQLIGPDIINWATHLFASRRQQDVLYRGIRTASTGRSAHFEHVQSGLRSTGRPAPMVRCAIYPAHTKQVSTRTVRTTVRI